MSISKFCTFPSPTYYISKAKPRNSDNTRTTHQMDTRRIGLPRTTMVMRYHKRSARIIFSKFCSRPLRPTQQRKIKQITTVRGQTQPRPAISCIPNMSVFSLSSFCGFISNRSTLVSQNSRRMSSGPTDARNYFNMTEQQQREFNTSVFHDEHEYTENQCFLAEQYIYGVVKSEQHFDAEVKLCILR